MGGKSKYDKAVSELNHAELLLVGACRRVKRILPPARTLSNQMGGPPVLDDEVAGARGPASSSHVRAAPGRRRVLTTICPDCKQRERELYGEELDAQVQSSCDHGISDEVFYKNELSAFPVDQQEIPVSLHETRIPSRGSCGRLIVPFPEDVSAVLENMAKYHSYVIEKQQLVLDCSEFIDAADEAERKRKAYENLDYWDKMVDKLNRMGIQYLSYLKGGAIPPWHPLVENMPVVSSGERGSETPSPFSGFPSSVQTSTAAGHLNPTTASGTAYEEMLERLRQFETSCAEQVSARSLETIHEDITLPSATASFPSLGEMYMSSATPHSSNLIRPPVPSMGVSQPGFNFNPQTTGLLNPLSLSSILQPPVIPQSQLQTFAQVQSHQPPI